MVKLRESCDYLDERLLSSKIMPSQTDRSPATTQGRAFKPLELTRLSEKILKSLCRDPKAQDFRGGTVSTQWQNALDFLNKTVPDFRSYLRGKILDFGCGLGNQSVAMAKAGADEVVGLDIRLHDQAKRMAAENNCSDRVRFVASLPPEDLGTFDMVLSCSAMEHYADPGAMLELMKQAVKPGGVVIISFAEPWYGPRGSHFDAFSRLPWVNLFFSERTIMRVRTHFRFDGAQRFEDVEGGLNRMSVAKFDRIIRASGLKREFSRVYITKGLPWLEYIPIARELFASAAACVLRKTATL
jgi:2-polyprenyl-3-methyl-5-hydroxy-6-metoxy-1,4-benzoquinol methylase